jgi:hypothetical protein
MTLLSRTLGTDSPIPTHDKFLAYDSKLKTISHITASAFGASGSTYSKFMARRSKSPTHTPGMKFLWRSGSIYIYHRPKQLQSAIQKGKPTEL